MIHVKWGIHEFYVDDNGDIWDEAGKIKNPPKELLKLIKEAGINEKAISNR